MRTAYSSNYGTLLLRQLALVLALGCATIQAAEEEGFVPLFNGKDLSGWVNGNCAPETWTVKDGMIHCTGFPTGAMRTDRQYENFILELDWRHLKSGGNSGVFIWGTPISAPGVPFFRGIEVQVLDNGFDIKGKNEWYTTHGDIFPIHGATMKPTGRSTKSRSFPSEDRSKSSPEWNHYRVECNNGTVRLSVNGKEVTVGEDCNYRKGYLALESEGAPVEFKNIRIKELPTTNTPPEMTAPLDQGFRTLYTGVDLKGWKNAEAAAARWKPSDWILTQNKADDDKRVDLTSDGEWGDAEFSIDFHPKAALPEGLIAGMKFRGLTIPFGNATLKADKWGRFKVNVKGRAVTVFLNDKEINKLELPEGAPAKGPLALIDAGVNVEFAGIYVRELKD